MSQYLERYTLTGSRRTAQWVAQAIAQEAAQAANSRGRLPTALTRTLCVPMYDESPEFFHRLCRHPDIHGTLVITCINAPDSAASEPLAATRRLLQRARELGREVDTTSYAWLRRLTAERGAFYLLVLDHCTEGRCLPVREGVGRARRIAADIAFALHVDRQVSSRWMFQTDADATLSDNYFCIRGDLDHCVAVHADFCHRAPGQTSLAQRLYDLSLDYYVVGLAAAKSPYAYYSLGSALAIDSSAYAAVRGYPRRSAGEDFYILNKLAKLGRVRFDPSRRVTLEERQSERVPFGTGPGVRKFSELNNPLEARLFYAPSCFIALGQWLAFIEDTLSSDTPVPDIRSAFVAFVSPEVSEIAVAALEQLKLFDWLQHLLDRYGSIDQAEYQVKIAMDALKTLRLVHALRDCGFANVTAAEAIAWMTTTRPYRSDPGVRALRTELVTTTQSLPSRPFDEAPAET